MARSRVKAKFVPDHKEFDRFATSDQMLQPLYEAAHKIRERAQGTAPRSDGPGPHYADQFKVDASAGVLRIGAFRRRIVAVVNEHPNAVRVEFGNNHVPAQHILAKAASEHGEYRGVMPGD